MALGTPTLAWFCGATWPVFTPPLTFGEFTRPVMPGATCLDPDQTRLDTLEEGQNLRPPERAVERDLTLIGDAMNLKDVLGQIQADGRNSHGWLLSHADHDTCTMAHRDAGEQEPSTPSVSSALWRAAAKVGGEPTFFDAALSMRGAFGGSCRRCSMKFHMALDPHAEAYRKPARKLLQSTNRLTRSSHTGAPEWDSTGAPRFSRAADPYRALRDARISRTRPSTSGRDG